MSWLLLLFAGLFEIAWALGLKYSEGFTRLWPSVLTVCALIASLTLLGLSLRQLPLGTAYAVWSGIGALGTVTLGVLLFGESVSPLRLISVGLILIGIAGLKLA
ncbi:quaternary ammonium compound efflux SMR transporter SugE [Cellvibrio sp. ARAG 10.3]|uniref:quaternary ammonium compound efflux SMR transporter SugE n=1 Tax=Cellvibrio sp. ARAG 10.3 TaxID=3451358 RepID=UPI003F473B39